MAADDSNNQDQDNVANDDYSKKIAEKSVMPDIITPQISTEKNGKDNRATIATNPRQTRQTQMPADHKFSTETKKARLTAIQTTFEVELQAC